MYLLTSVRSVAGFMSDGAVVSSPPPPHYRSLTRQHLPPHQYTVHTGVVLAGSTESGAMPARGHAESIAEHPTHFCYVIIRLLQIKQRGRREIAKSLQEYWYLPRPQKVALTLLARDAQNSHIIAEEYIIFYVTTAIFLQTSLEAFVDGRIILKGI